MDLHQLYVFTKVVEHKSFSKAADDISLSQSTVSSHIHSLEKSLNITLFDRVGRESILTSSGQRLYEWARKLLLLKDEALLDLNVGLKDLRGDIRIAASSVPGQFLVPNMVKLFREECPSVTFHINQSPSKVVAEKVLSGAVDVGILGEKYDNEKLCYIPLLKEGLVLVSPSHMKIRSPLNIHEIIRHPMVLRGSESGTNALLEKFFKKNNISKDQLNVIAYTDCGQSLIQFVKQGIAISIISEIASREYSAANPLVATHQIDGFTEERYFYLVYNVNRTLSMATKLFIEKAKELLLEQLD
ncbi:selenium metabolism-associated LysR family transcriptional regulator [Mesobacillus harenae]|uniref:selenium metabolism-associated LysR family transcriptional regulator n=1 Tax=Mesobacillus harenae TaxID=2213203 RepID=UPI001580958F|nr:selenium metabolism-associated LysR family transcriptional regulator [Mesobacillus harenae]